MFNLLEFGRMTIAIAKKLEVKPEEVTQEFIDKMRERMRADEQFESMVDEQKTNDVWDNKCRRWAQEILAEQSSLR